MLEKANKNSLFWLIILTVVIVFFGFWQIRYNIFNPFKQPGADQEPLEMDIIDAYKNLDTDEDGLSDYEEMYVYNTSIFLNDSDGDGFSDKDEIDAGSNPLNPDSTPLNKEVTQEKTVLEQEIDPPASGGSEEKFAQEIRDLLINQAGLSPEIVNSLLDKDLITLYNETKQETGINLQDLAEQAIRSGNFSQSEQMIEEIDPQVLRQLLIGQGVDPKILGQIDDQGLKELFRQSLEQNQ